MRVAVAGGPRTGKTTFAGTLGVTVRHTDDLIGLGWSEASEAAAGWFDEPGAWCIEGVAVPRALRKWLRSHDTGRPCEVVYWFDEPRQELSRGQTAMAKGCAAVWYEIKRELESRGVEVRCHGAK